jgi:LmbE family N-acetylglucosaminyl deacetylase
VIVAAAAMLFAGVAALRAPSVNIDSIDSLRELNGRDRILIFAPHCDDETLGTGGLIMKALKKGAKVRVVLITNGDNNLFSTDIEFRTFYPNAKKYIEAGEKRQSETIEAMKFFGLGERDVIFLGYPDRGIKRIYLKHWDNGNPYRSRATHAFRSPYRRNYDPHALYSGENILKNIRGIILDFKPTIIVAPHPNDRHPDHKYSYEFIRRAVYGIYYEGGGLGGTKPFFLTYLVHHHYYPRPGGLKPESYLLPPFSSSFDTDWYKLMLSDEERDRKYDAIRLYKSQIVVPEVGRLMRGFVRENELFESVSFE